MRILIADDDADTCLLVGAILKNAGHSPVVARDAAQAFMLAQRQPRPELILLDIRMPAGTGIGALTKLKASRFTATIPVLVLSGVEDPEIEREALVDGALEFLHKPVDEAVLLGAIQRVMDRTAGGTSPA